MTIPDPTLLYNAVQTCPLATELSPEQTTVLAELVTMVSVKPNEVIAHEGAADSRLYVIVEGSLCVIKQKGKVDETLIATLHKGDFAHELGFLDGSLRYASLIALTEARVLVLERQKLESLIDTQPRVLYLVMCAIVRTVHRIQTRLAMQANELTNYITKQHGRY